jgi:endonuclease G
MRRSRKNRIIYTILLGVVVVLFWIIEHYLSPADKGDKPGEAISLPAFVLPGRMEGEVIDHTYYALEYSEIHEQAKWVTYLLSRSHLTDDDRKRPYFIEDPKVKTFSADWRNYKNSGYDRGHLCPAGDRRFSERAYKETFYTSNISPMQADFNAGVWNRLEIQVRSWARRYDSLYVITGGVLHKGLQGIGYESVSVPRAFYKVVLRGNPSHPETIAFLIPHRESSRPLEDYRVSIDYLEQETGIDFFKALEDSLESELEKQTSRFDWPY